MAITPRGDSFLVSVTINGKRYRKTVKTQAEAELIEARAKLDLSQGKDPDHGNGTIKAAYGVTMRDLFKKTCLEYWRDLNSKPRRNAELVLDLMDWWNVSPVDINGEKLSEAWEACRKVGNSESTVNRKKAALSKMFSVAREFHWMHTKPAGLKQTKERTGRVRIMTPAEEQRFIDIALQLEYKRLAALFTFLLDTGARVSEALAINPQDVTDKGVYLDTLKGGAPRLIPLTRRAKEAVLAWSGMTQNVVNNQWDRVRGLMGLLEDAQFVPHVCRHTCASRLVMGGMDLRRVKEWLGHSTINTTMRYAHLMPNALQDGLTILEK